MANTEEKPPITMKRMLEISIMIQIEYVILCSSSSSELNFANIGISTDERNHGGDTRYDFAGIDNILKYKSISADAPKVLMNTS